MAMYHFSSNPEDNVPWWMLDEAGQLSIPHIVLQELVREQGVQEAARLLNDPETMKAAVVAAHKRLRQRLLREEGLAE